MARTGRVADDIAQAWLDDLAIRTTHLGVCSDDPFAVMDPLTVEPIGGLYHRSAVDLVRTDLLLRNAGALVWVGLPIGTVVTYLAGWDAYSNGNPTFSCPVGPIDFPAGGGFTIDAEDFFWGLGT